MSEFSDTVLVQTKHTVSVLEALKLYPHRYKWHQLNDRWLAVFLEYPNYDFTSAREWMMGTSVQFPLLFLQKSSDHGWSYQIFSLRHIVAEVKVNYELTWHMWVDLMEIRHPEMEFPYHEVKQDEVARMYAEIESSEAFHVQAAEQYQKAAPDMFRLFGFDNEHIRHIRRALEVGWYIDQTRRYEQVNAFTSSIELEAFDWMSFSYLSN